MLCRATQAMTSWTAGRGRRLPGGDGEDLLYGGGGVGDRCSARRQ